MSATAPMDDDEDDESCPSRSSELSPPDLAASSSSRGWQKRMTSPHFPKGSTLDEDSSESFHYGDDDLGLEESATSPVGVAAQPRFLSDGSSTKDDDEDYDIELI